MKKIFRIKIVKTVINILKVIIITLILLEIGLRIQQALGPVYDLDEFELPLKQLNLLDDTLNHKPVQKKRDENDIKTYRPSCDTSPDSVKVLFLGDSFMQGRRNNTIPQGAYNYIRKVKGDKKCLDFMNGGVSSYSTAIYIVQARKLIRLKKPDFVVVEFDETDLMDDFLRYRKLMIRDESGNLIAVRHSPTQKEWIKGFVEIKAAKLFITRLVKKIYHELFHMPKVMGEFYDVPISYATLLAPSLCREDTQAYKKHKKEIDFFKKNLCELAETIISEIGGPEKILFSYHPHYLHIYAGRDGQRYNTVVSSVISEISDRYNIRFYNSTADIKKQFGANIKDFYRWPRDKFSHFTKKGYLLYGELIGRQLLPLIECKSTALDY